MIGYLYNRDFGYNILLLTLQHQGESENPTHSNGPERPLGRIAMAGIYVKSSETARKWLPRNFNGRVPP